MKTGIIFLASRSGRVIIPTAYACRSPWWIRGSWTDMQLPMPFTRVHAPRRSGLLVPPNLSKRKSSAVYAQRLQAEMERQEAIAMAAVLGRTDEHPIATQSQTSHRAAA